MDELAPAPQPEPARATRSSRKRKIDHEEVRFTNEGNWHCVCLLGG